MITRNVASVLLLAAVIIIMSAGPVYAYIDPGTGSMVLQIVIGGMLACMFGIKMFWRRIKTMISSRTKMPVDEDVPSDSGATQLISETKEDCDNAGTK